MSVVYQNVSNEGTICRVIVLKNEFGNKNNLGPIWTELFFGCLNHQFQLLIIVFEINMQNQQNLMKQSGEQGRKPFGLFWARLA